jgi:hypothetical protein
MILEIVKMEYDEFKQHVWYITDEQVFRKINNKVWHGLQQLMKPSVYAAGFAADIWDEIEIDLTLQIAQTINRELKKYAF